MFASYAYLIIMMMIVIIITDCCVCVSARECMVCCAESHEISKTQAKHGTTHTEKKQI